MAGKKRTRNKAGAAAARGGSSSKSSPAKLKKKEAAAAPDDEPITIMMDEMELPSSPLFVLLQALHALASDPALCQTVLHALAVGTAPVLDVGVMAAAGVGVGASSNINASSWTLLLGGGAPRSAASTTTAATAAAAGSAGKKKKKRARVSAAAATAPDTPAANALPQQQEQPDTATSVNPVAKGGFWILLATHMLNRLLASLEAAPSGTGTGDDNTNNNRTQKISQLVALIAYFLARILLPLPSSTGDNNSNAAANHDRAMHKLLEKACANRAKSLLGRAILSITVGATTALHYLVQDNNTDDTDSSLSLACWIPATLALDSVVRLSHACPKAYSSTTSTTSTTTTTTTAATASPVPSSGGSPTAAASWPATASSPMASSALSTTTNTAVQFWNLSRDQLEHTAMTIMGGDDDANFTLELEAICKDISQDLGGMTRLEVPCLAALLEIGSSGSSSTLTKSAAAAAAPAAVTEEASSPVPPAAKRAATRRKSSRGATSSASGAATQASETASTNAAAAAAQESATNSHPLLQAFQALFSNNNSDDDDDNNITVLNTIKMDGRVAAKRWSSMALVWLMQGQKSMLEAILGMLSRRLEWHNKIGNTTPSDDDDDNDKMAVIPGNVALLALVSRIIGIVTETHAQSGSRAPSGGLDTYVRAILPQATTGAAASTKKAAATPTLGKKAPKRAPKAVFPDLRNLATVVLYHLLQAHEDCLEVNHQRLVNSEGKPAVRLVNDEDNENDENAIANNPSSKSLTYNPIMRPLVEGLCRAVATTTSDGAGATSYYVKQALGLERLQKLASVFVMENIREDATSSTAVEMPEALSDPVLRQERPLDVQLVRFALTHFKRCLLKSEVEDPECEAMSDSEYNGSIVASRYHLLEPLPVPDYATPSHGAAAPGAPVTRRVGGRGGRAAAANPSPVDPASISCSYAGVFASVIGENAQGPHEDDVLSLFVRSMVTLDGTAEIKTASRSKPKRKQTKRAKGTTNDADLSSPATKLHSTLLAVVQSAYDGSSDVDPSVAMATAKPAGGKAKRAAPLSKGSGRKRRKANDGSVSAVQEADEDSPSSMKERKERPPLNVHRAALAEEANTVLRKLISTLAIADTRKTSMVRTFIRLSFRKEHLYKITELTSTLDDLVIVPRTVEFLNKKVQPSTSLPPDAPGFASFEKALWLSNLHLCTAIGQDGTSGSSDESSSSSERILSNSKIRLAFFQAIAKSGLGENHWPLWLPPALRGLVSIDVASQLPHPISANENSVPEQFIVNGFIQSVSKTLEGWETFPKPDICASEDRIAVDYGLPLSLQDARLFLVAVGRLSAAERIKSLAKLLFGVQSSIEMIAGNDSATAVVTNNSDFSSLVARIITVCSNLTILVAYPDLWQRLKNQVKQSQAMDMPGFVSECDWYRSERCYMGVFSDWESAMIPLSEGCEVNAFSSTVVNALSEMLEKSFALGFKSAKSDRGHLLYGAWNAIGNRALWDPRRSSDRPRSSTLESLLTPLHSMQEEKNVGITQIMLQCREDICRMYVDMQTHAGQAESLPFASKLTQAKDRSASTTAQIKKGLKSFVTTGEKAMTALLECEETPSELFSCLEVAATYITFGVASHTKPTNEDAFSILRAGLARHRRPRGYSSDSERDHSDLDSVDSESDEDDPSSNLRERLQNACAAFGAAPTHPDWLDDDCHLQFGFVPSEALDAGRTAVRALTKLLSVAFERHNMCLQHAMKVLRKDPRRQASADQDILARKLLVLISRYGLDPQYFGSLLKDDAEENEDPGSELFASLCNIETGPWDVYTSGRASEMEETQTAWCPNSAQRILGRGLIGSPDVACSLPELRVDKQWELLLGTSLATSCRSEDLEYPEEARKALLDAENWFRVCETTVSSMVSAAALLRFGLARGGRQTHSLALDNGDDRGEEGGIFACFNCVERLPVSMTASKQLRDIVCEAVGLLARWSAQCSGEMASSLSCHAVATNLLLEGTSFEHLRGFESCRFALTTLSELQEAYSRSAAPRNSKALQFLNRRLTSIVDFWGSELEDDNELGRPNSSSNSQPFGRLMELLCNSKGHRNVDTVAENGVLEASAMLAFLDGKRHQIDSLSPQEAAWRWGELHEKPLLGMVALLGQDRADADLRTRTCLARILNRVTFFDYEKQMKGATTKNFIVNTILKAFNSITEEDVRGLLAEVAAASDESNEGMFQKETCSFLACLVSDRTRPRPAVSRVELVVNTLVASSTQWLALKPQSSNHILDVLTLFGCYNDSLAQVGSIFLNNTSAGASYCLESIERFLRFIQNLKLALKHGGEGTDPPSASAATGNTPSSTSRGTDLASGTQAPRDNLRYSPQQAPPRACSYASKAGFHGQHWYNCETCGLTWDKGCCTLCALVCHEGHDVSYSRYSSFFCDCGAEDGGENRVSCSCLSTASKDKVRELFEKEGWSMPNGSVAARNKIGSRKLWETTQEFYFDIAKGFPNSALSSSLDTLIGEAKRQGWLEKLFERVRTEFELWTATGNDPSLDVTLAGGFDLVESQRYEFLRQSLHGRNGKVLCIEPLAKSIVVPIRAAKANSFQVKFSGSNKRSKNDDIGRAAIVADSRGRLIIAESCSLLFCSAAASVNLKHTKDPSDRPMSRSSLCILGSSPTKFAVKGMEICSENDRHLILWGASEACVAVLKETHDGVDSQITLALDLDPSESDSDYVVKCHWIPGSQTCVAVGCGRMLHLFDISSADSDNRALPIISFGLGGFESNNLRDLAFVPADRSSRLQLRPFSVSRSANAASLFVLLEDGRLHCVDLEYDKDGKLTARGEQQFESGESIPLPTAGVRPHQAATIGLPGSQSHSLGDGGCLAYLAQSNLLLYKCSASCVLALTIGATGKIRGSFEFLPHMISSAMLGSSADDIGGPYSHWTELGQSHDDDGDRFFRVTCVGRSWRTNQPKLLSIEFNDATVKVREVTWDSDSSGLGLSLYSSFEGVCAFSLPFRCENAVDPDSDDGSCFAERAFLCAVTSNGCLLLYGEETGMSMSRAKPDALAARGSDVGGTSDDKPFVSDRSVLSSFPITIFERLKNASEDCPDELCFAGDGFGSDSKEIRKKLSRDNSVFLMSPRRDGSTLTISLRRTSKHLAIMAVRFLVGSTSTEECIPRRICVAGRNIEIEAGKKKWYSISLTDEEIALTMRAGVLAIGISQTWDSASTPLLDSLEVYVSEKQSIASWLPRMLSRDMPILPVVDKERRDDSKAAGALVLACSSLESLYDILGPGQSLANESDLLKQMVQETTINPNRVICEKVDNLLIRLYPSPQARNSIKDEGTLQGCSLLLSQCQTLLQTSQGEMSDEEDSGAARSFENAWFTVRVLLLRVLSESVKIARCRPINYLRSSDQLQLKKMSSGSIAVDSSNIIGAAINLGLPAPIIVYVDLALAETAIGDNTDADQGEKLASFIIVRKLLECPNLTVVERSCHAISSFCRSYGAGDQTSGERNNDGLFSALQAARVVCYQCDNCGKVPITGVRYTLLEDDHDVDLCRGCYQQGLTFSEAKNFDENTKVVINGKALELNCALIQDMQPVPIVKADVREPDPDDPADENEELQRALRLSLENDVDHDGIVQVSHKVDQSLEDFVDRIFSSILDLLGNALEGPGGEPRLGLLLSLLTDLVHHSSEQAGKLARAKMLAAAISSGASRLIAVSANNSNKDFQRSGRLALTMCLRSLAYVISESPSKQELPPAETSSNTDRKGGGSETRQVLCDVHGVPAARRRCARGEHKDRRFYVCGKERALRCKFFVWTDHVGQKAASTPKLPQSQYEKDLSRGVWTLFSSSMGTATTEVLQVQLCNLLEGILDGWRSTSGGPVKLNKGGDGGNDDFQRLGLYDNERAISDFSDGVFCSREKLFDFSAEKAWRCTKDASTASIASIAASFYADGDGDVQLIESSLELLALIASNETKTDGMSWYRILSEIISSPNKSSRIRTLAKRGLKQLCAGKKDLYHCVRDHYLFNEQARKLGENTRSLVRSSLLIVEQSRQSGFHWKNGSTIGSWDELKAGGLIGTEMLISEDCASLQANMATGEILEELWNAAKNRQHNWRRFCGLDTTTAEKASSEDDDLLGEFLAPAPIISLMWIACSVVGSNQIKALKLVDLALTNGKESKQIPAKHKESNSDAKASTSWLHSETKSPEDLLLHGKRKCDVGDLHAFLMHFAYMGRTAEVRRVACSIASKLLQNMDAGLLLGQILQGPLCDAGWLGKNSVEFLNLVQSQLRAATKLPVQVTNTADMVLLYFKTQFQAIKHDRANGEWVCLESASGASRKLYDLSLCVHCHTAISPSKDTSGKVSESRSGTSRALRSGTTQVTVAANNASSSRASQSASKREWLSPQVSPYTRGRLDSSKESTANDAFCSYRQLKYRLALSEIHVNVNDPRGRFVKSVNVYFTPRPVDDVQVLKSDSYLGRWQRCATLNLTRGASRASCTLSVPVIAANLKLEYTDFYERPGGSKASDGSFLVHCPRCSRVVNNAHGVCGNCGEVAFQCRKCRHINYDQLQSFLCVECGFCSAGSFSFDLVAGVASNAVAITNDDDYERTVRMHNTATRLNADLKEALKEKLRTVIHLRKTLKEHHRHEHRHQNRDNSSVGDQNAAPNSFFLSPGLRRAFHDQDLNSPVGAGSSAVGLATDILLERAGKKGWGVKMIAMPAPIAGASPSISPGASAAERTRSLLQLARQLRTDSAGGSSESRRRSGDVIIRQVGGRGGAEGGGAAAAATAAIEGMDEDTDLLSLLENAGASALGLTGLPGAAAAATAGGGLGGILDSTDPLSRLLTSFQTTRNSAGQARASSGQSGTGAGGGGQAAGASNVAATRSRSSTRTSATTIAPGGSSSAINTTAGGSGRKQQNDAVKEALEECDKLHALMRETECEAYELKRRMTAWRRLEADELANRGTSLLLEIPSLMESIPENTMGGGGALITTTNNYNKPQRPPRAFAPSHCSVCSGPVAVQLLFVWLRLFQADPASAAGAISQDAIEMLLEENMHLSQPLMDLKRHVVCEIAVLAPACTSRLVLQELAKRLRAARDVTSAEILGKIISEDSGSSKFELAQDYVDLAMEVLQHETIIY